MTEKLKQTIKEEMAKLPKETQEAINAFDWLKVTEEIGKKYSLNESAINDFQAETSLILIGIEDRYSYAFNIKNNVGVDMDKAEEIANEALEKIFEPIANIMEENIKKNMKDKNISPAQNIDFILSGGDYSVFVAPTQVGVPTQVGKEDKTKLLGTSNILEVKDRLIN
jgi:hypothetical protein